MLVKWALEKCYLIRDRRKAEALCSQLLPNFEVVKEGTSDDAKGKMLVDIGNQTSVARADLVAREKWDSETKIAVRCVHGDSAYYPLAVVRVGIDGVWKVVRVALIPEMPVDLLIGVNDGSIVPRLYEWLAH